MNRNLTTSQATS